MSSDANSCRQQRLQEALASYLQAREAGNNPDRQEWLARYPDLAGELADFFANHDQFARLAQPVAPPALRRLPPTTPARDDKAMDTTPDVGHYFGDYEVLGEIARGGMGVVLRARQVSLNRPVALKMILAGQLASDADVQRFRTEAEAAASLDHPHIVPIYEIGEHEGQQYFSMKLVEGPSLAQLLEDSTWQTHDVASQRRGAELIATVARAVHYAHQSRILHRDLKPANILLSRRTGAHRRDKPGGSQRAAGLVPAVGQVGSLSYEPHVTDFGLAKRVEGDSKVTQSGAIVGTPSYMAPEQARGEKRLTTAADVYSLGAILHELLTGRPPFRGATPLDTLLDVVDKELPPPRLLNPHIDHDLETICLKCLDKDPTRRYGSAEALAEDLERWLRGEPIQARRTGMAERTLKWARRRPAIAALLGLLLLVSGLGVAGIVWQWLDARAVERDALLRAAAEAKARGEAQDARKKEEDAKNEALKARALEARARQDEHNARTKAEDERDAKEKALVRAEGLRLSAEASAALHTDPGLSLLLALEGVQRTPHRLTFNVLHEAVRDCREVRTLTILSRGVRYSPDGRFLLTSSSTWDPVTGKALASLSKYGVLHSCDLSPDGQRVVSTMAGYQTVYYRDGKRPEKHVFTDRVAYVWSAATGKELLHLRKHRDHIVSARFSPDSKLVLTASWDGTAALWDAGTGKRLHLLKGHTCSLRTALFSPDGQQVLTVASGLSEGGNCLQWTLEEERTPNKPDAAERDPGIVSRRGMLGDSGYMHSAMSTPGENPIARVWDTRTGKQAIVLMKPPTGGLSFTVRGKRLTIPLPEWVKHWLPRSWWPLLGHPGHPTGALYSAGGKRVAIAFREGTVCVWELPGGGLPRWTLRVHEGPIRAIAFSPDGKHLVTGGDDRSVRVWEPQGRTAPRIFWGHQGPVRVVRFSADGKQLLTGSDDHTARLWDVATGETRAIFRGHTEEILSAEFSPDGRHVVTAAADRTARIWSVAPPVDPVRVLPGHTVKLDPSSARHARYLNSLAFSRDGTRLLTAGKDDTPRLWDIATGKEVLRIGKDRQLGEVHSARFSADGHCIVTASAHTYVSIHGKVINSSAVHLWDAQTGADVLALKDHKHGAFDALFSPDGKVVVTISSGLAQPLIRGSMPKGVSTPTGNTKPGLVRLWDADSGKLLLTLNRTQTKGSSHHVPFAPLFSPDGKHLLVKAFDEPVFHLVDLAGKTRHSFDHSGEGWGVHFFAAFSPDGRRLFTAAGRQKACVWDTAKGVPVVQFNDFPDGVTVAAFSPDSRRIAIAAGKHAYLWDVSTRKLLAIFQGHEDQILTAVFHPDGNQLLTGSSDGMAILWDTVSGKARILYTGHAAPVHLVAFSPDGKQVATGAGDGTARIWPTDLLAVVRQRLPREFTPAERERYAVDVSAGIERPLNTKAISCRP
jgi:WD40 repeat protein